MVKIIKKDKIFRKRFKIITIFILLLLFPLTFIFTLLNALIAQVLDEKFKVKITFLLLWNVIWQHPHLIAIGAIIAIGVLGIFLYKIFKTDKDSKVQLKETSDTTYGSAKWLSETEINRYYPQVNYQALSKTTTSGWVVGSYEQGKNTWINLTNNVHNLIIGGTGSGKTQGIVIPTIQINAQNKVKPSLVITDPKGELYATQSLLLQQQGYDIKVLNLRDNETNFTTDFWNPLRVIYDFWKQAILSQQQNNFKQSLFYKSRAIQEINDLALVIFSSKDNNSKDFFNQNASDIMKAIVLGILEDWENGIVNLTPEQFNLVTVRISLNKGEALISWLAQREDTSIAKTMATALLTQGGMQAKGNFIQVVASKMNIFMDFQIRNLVCQHNIDFNTLDEQPTAIFIIVPDERLDRHMFISLFISQLYKALITKANGLLEKKLQKPVYFICDEFGNIPSIPNMDGIITVARSRNIYFMLIIQNYGQLEVKYGEKMPKQYTITV